MRRVAAAIGEPHNRHRKAASLGRQVERLMLLDAVLADRSVGWMGTEQDQLAYFRALLRPDFLERWYPHLTFGDGDRQTRRYFPEKLPIGVPRGGDRQHVFCYLVTKDVPAECRLSLLRYADLLRAVDAWTIRLLVPRRLLKAQAVYRYAVRDTFLLPLRSSDVTQLDWYFRARRGEAVEPSPDPELDVARSAQKYGAARFAALHRHWERDGIDALWSAQSVSLGDHMQYGSGRVEVVELPHQYLQLTPLVGVA